MGMLHGGPERGPALGLSQLRTLELEPATQGSQELAHLGWAGSLGRGGSAHPACPHARQAPGTNGRHCGASWQSLQREAQLAREPTPRLLHSALLSPHVLWAVTPPGLGSAVCIGCFWKHLLCARVLQASGQM